MMTGKKELVDEDDTEFRTDLVKMLGLDKAPSTDIRQLACNLEGCLAGDLPDDFDATKAVREIRDGYDSDDGY